MRMVRQPKRSKLCAQACVASLMWTSLQDAVRLCGEGELIEKQMVAALRGVKSQWRLLLISHSEWDHWLLTNKAGFWSPAIGYFVTPPQWILESLVTSRLELI